MGFTLKQAPKILITEIRTSKGQIQYFGLLDNLDFIKENNLGCIINEDKFIWGKFISIDQSSRQTIFKAEDTEVFLEKEKSFPFLDAYWGSMAELILDKNRNWQKIVFRSSDADKFKLDNVIGWQIEGEKLPKGAEYIGKINDGWDHEHCELCFQKISEYEENNISGFVDENNNWICTNCFEKYVSKRSLEFINI